MTPWCRQVSWCLCCDLQTHHHHYTLHCLALKCKGTRICIAPHRENLAPEALRYGSHTAFTLQIYHTCLYLVSVHQTAPPLATGSSDPITAYYSFINPVRMKGWVGTQKTVYPYKWLPVSCRSLHLTDMNPHAAHSIIHRRVLNVRCSVHLSVLGHANHRWIYHWVSATPGTEHIPITLLDLFGILAK